MSQDVTVLSTTQKIIVDPGSRAVAVISSGPIGPAGPSGPSGPEGGDQFWQWGEDVEGEISGSWTLKPADDVINAPMWEFYIGMLADPDDFNFYDSYLMLNNTDPTFEVQQYYDDGGTEWTGRLRLSQTFDPFQVLISENDYAIDPAAVFGKLDLASNEFRVEIQDQDGDNSVLLNRYFDFGLNFANPDGDEFSSLLIDLDGLDFDFTDDVDVADYHFAAPGVDTVNWNTEFNSTDQTSHFEWGIDGMMLDIVDTSSVPAEDQAFYELDRDSWEMWTHYDDGPWGASFYAEAQSTGIRLFLIEGTTSQIGLGIKMDPSGSGDHGVWLTNQSGNKVFGLPGGGYAKAVTTFVEFDEIADPSAPAANDARLYAKDNGSGKTQLVVRFPTGAVQVLATEP